MPIKIKKSPQLAQLDQIVIFKVMKKINKKCETDKKINKNALLSRPRSWRPFANADLEHQPASPPSSEAQ